MAPEIKRPRKYDIFRCFLIGFVFIFLPRYEPAQRRLTAFTIAPEVRQNIRPSFSAASFVIKLFV